MTGNPSAVTSMTWTRTSSTHHSSTSTSTSYSYDGTGPALATADPRHLDSVTLGDRSWLLADHLVDRASYADAGPPSGARRALRPPFPASAAGARSSAVRLLPHTGRGRRFFVADPPTARTSTGSRHDLQAGGDRGRRHRSRGDREVVKCLDESGVKYDATVFDLGWERYGATAPSCPT
jgi:hypothetical protein